MSIIKGTFVSEWAYGSIIETEGTINNRTGEVTAKSVESDDCGSVVREYFKFRERRENNEWEVCTTCHQFILTTKMIPDQVGKGLTETKVCSDPTCDSNQ